MKDTLFWNSAQNNLRSAQGVPQPVPVYPNINSTAQEILDFTTETIFHVSSETSKKEAVYLFVSSPVTATIFVKIISSEMLTPNGSKTRIKSYPTTIDALTYKIRENQPSPVAVLQGHTICNGAGISLFSSNPGPKAFGFIVKE